MAAVADMEMHRIVVPDYAGSNPVGRPLQKRRTKMNYPVINPVETGRRINRLRKSKGLSVPYLRDYFGFSTTNAIYKWLRGDTLPSLDNMFALSLLLGESVNDILVAECGDERTTG